VTASPSYNAYKRAGWHIRYLCGESPQNLQNLQKGVLEVLEALASGKSPRFASISQVTDPSTLGH
jgi:hypothetical protein